MMQSPNSTTWGRYDPAQRQDVTIRTGDVFGRNEIIGAGQGADHPHAYLVEQLPSVSLPPHFHLTDQFQVVVAGGGMLGRNHALRPITVHYARGKTGYGPIVANGEGLAYLTLRPRVEYGGHYLSDPRTVVDRAAPKFQTTSAPTSLVEHPLARGEVRTLISPQADGPAAWAALRSAGQSLVLPQGAEGFACFQIVMRGTAVAHGEVLPPWSCIWHAPGAQPSAGLVAGSEGAELVILSFPRSSTESPISASSS